MSDQIIKASDVKQGDVIRMKLTDGTYLTGYVDAIQVSDLGRITFTNNGQTARRSMAYRPGTEIDVLARRGA